MPLLSRNPIRLTGLRLLSTPHWRPRLKFAFLAIAVIAIILGAMFEFQSKLIFPTHAVADAGPLPQGAERLSVRTPDGAMLSGVYVPADASPASKRLLLGFGGNAWNGQDVAEYLHELFPEEEVVAFHYRGYAPSTGQPSAEAIIADAPLIYDCAIERVKPARIVAV